MNRIFLSYRADDSADATMAISDRLAHHFGRDQIFRDQDSLRVGMLYPRRIRRALERSDTVLAVIGPRWLDTRDHRGRRRVDDPRDWVRTELRMAFEREIPVVPVLLDQTPLPTRDRLPGDLGLLPLSTFHRVRSRSLTADVQALIGKLDPLGNQGGPGRHPAAPNTQYTVVDGQSVANVNQNGTQIVNWQGHDGTRR